MNETNSPLPQPSGATCPNCGAPQSASAAICSNCGAPLRAATPPGGLSRATKIIASIALAFGALLFGAFGGCIMLIGGIEGGSMDATLLLLIVVPALLAVACIWGIFRIQRQ